MKKVVEDRETLDHFEVLSLDAESKNLKTGEISRAVIFKDYKRYSPEKKDYVKVPDNKKEIYVKEFVDFNKRYNLVLDL